MSSDKIFARYIQLAEMLGKMFQNLLEVVIHDFKDLDHSVIFIVNGHISNRKVGDAASELGIRRLLEEDAIPDVLVNYVNQTSRGQKLKSASMAIRDDTGKMIGAFCLNFDMSHFEQFQRFLDFFMNCETNRLVGNDDINVKRCKSEEEIQNEISQYILQKGLSALQLTYKDKQAIVAHLQDTGYFKRRGAIGKVASSLQLTRQSIYNYLSKKGDA